MSRVLKVQNIVQKIGNKKKQNLKAHTGSDEEVESFHGFTDSEIETASLKSGRSSVFSTSSRSKKQKILVKKPSLVKIQKRPKVDKKKKYKVPAAESDDEIESFTGFTDADIETASLKSGRSSIFSSSTASSKKSTISSISSSSKKSSLSSKSSGSKKSNASSISKKIKPSVKTVFNRNGTKMDIRKLKSKISGSKIDKETSATLKKHLKALYDSIYYWANADNILPIGVFMKLPCKKEYPDYYEVISKPIDMGIIDTRIKTGHYNSGLEMVGDCKLMFSNCRMYNEEGSAIYEDANILEEVLLSKAREIGVLDGEEDRLKNVHEKHVSVQNENSPPDSDIPEKRMRKPSQKVKENNPSQKTPVLPLGSPNVKKTPKADSVSVDRSVLKTEDLQTTAKVKMYLNTGWTKKKGVLKKRKSAMVGVF